MAKETKLAVSQHPNKTQQLVLMFLGPGIAYFEQASSHYEQGRTEQGILREARREKIR